MGFINIDVQHFRGFKDLKIENLKQINLFLGRNNVAKSSMLGAIFLLAGMSNFELNIRINHLRGFVYNTGDDFSMLFHDLDINMPVVIKAKETNGKKRVLSISPIYSETSDLQIKNPTAFLSNEIKPRIDGVNLDFEFDGKSYKGYSVFKKNEKGDMTFFGKSDENYKEHIKATYLCAKYSDTVLVDALNKAVNEKYKADIIDMLKYIEPSVSDIAVIGDLIKIDVGLKEFIPINFLGDGFRKVLAIIIAVYQTQGGILLIDELDNGLHFSVLSPFWKMFFKMVNTFNVQVFATTHNLELLETLKQTLEDRADYRDQVLCYSLNRYSKDEITAYRYDFENLEYAINHEIEMR